MRDRTAKVIIAKDIIIIELASKPINVIRFRRSIKQRLMIIVVIDEMPSGSK
jgi:hypothetical protein